MIPLTTRCNIFQPILLLVFCLGTSGCGNVGPPISPEDIGIEAKVLEQRFQSEEKSVGSSKGQDIVPIEDEQVSLPPLRPIGTR